MAGAQRIDLWSVPDPDRAAERSTLGLLGRMSERPALFEAFHRAPSPDDVLECAREQLNSRHELTRRAREADARSVPRPAALRVDPVGWAPEPRPSAARFCAARWLVRGGLRRRRRLGAARGGARRASRSPRYAGAPAARRGAGIFVRARGLARLAARIAPAGCRATICARIRIEVLQVPARGFNGAAALQRRRGGRAARLTRRRSRFNGAAALQRRRAIERTSLHRAHISLQWGRRSSAAEGPGGPRAAG